ncbi:ATPase [Halomonas sp. EGI 63088]|uniref:ATPase n=1 Tax=Halomonas flagellata TaxID=2920385 RepID=A0ABS9RRY9_9GAMM|nr:ATPase [Halomonas flagellata]MCH4562577.1 ATPase [Halomonas flagellata]
MNITTFHDVVEWTRALHEHLAQCLKHCASQHEEERAKWLLGYLSDHEAALETVVAGFEKQADPKALNTWLYDYQSYAPIKPHKTCTEPYAKMSFDEICQEIFDLHEQVIGFYRYLEGRTEIPETRALIGELLKLEEHEAMRLVHQTNRSRDL